MKYEAKQAIYLPITDYLNLEFFLMDNRSGVKPEPFVVELVKSDDEKSLTPSMFANRHAKGRNAWRFVWLRFPGNDHWVRAGNYRIYSEDLARKQSKTAMAAV